MIKLIDRLQSLLSQNRNPVGVSPSILCANGLRLSIQASRNHYCEPRSDTGPWTHVEVGFPSRVEPLLWPYAAQPGEWTDTIYGCVPIELVAAVIELHGGIAPDT